MLFKQVQRTFLTIVMMIFMDHSSGVSVINC
jgi:hypothetical protein